MINLLGAYLGDINDLLGSGPDNLEGFWENKDILDLHERLLQSLGRFWHDIRPLPDGWWMEAGVAGFRGEVEGLVRKYASEKTIWAWKDPRTAILLPMWQAILKDNGVHVDYVICLRNPIDVALSLSKIHKFPIAKSICLWQLYNLSALHWTNGSQRIMISYDELLENHETYLQEVLSNLRSGLTWEGMGGPDALPNVVVPDLRHNIHDSESVLRSNDIPDPVKRLYSLLLVASHDHSLVSTRIFGRRIDELYTQYREYMRIIVPALV